MGKYAEWLRIASWGPSKAQVTWEPVIGEIGDPEPSWAI
jgi:hypothetical protein